jgi:penicillin G amidase
MNIFFSFFFLILTLFIFSSCSFFKADISTQSRITDFEKIKLTTVKPVEVLWSPQLVPRIKAESSADLFYTLGAVQVHLRRSQLEIYRKLSRGALSEMVGPFSLKLDKFLKTIDFDHAAEISFKSMSKESLQVLEWMAAGMNDYISQSEDLPMDMKIMGIKNEKWSALDLIRVIKFTSMDVNWTVFSQLLDFKNEPFVNKVWDFKVNQKDFFEEFFKDHKFKKKETERNSQASYFFRKAISDLNLSFAQEPTKKIFNFSLGIDPFEYIKNVTKSGSNAFVVNGLHTKSGAGILSNDPHLGLVIPNIWLFVILDSPEYKTMGYIIPSFPVPVIGRNMDIAWGGTNLWGLSTYPTQLSEDDKKNVVEQTKKIKIRFWLDQKIKTFKLGSYPILKSKDFPQIGLRDIVFRWQGYEPSDELQTFLKVNRAKSFPEFHQAFESYGVAGMTFLYADKKGNIGKLIATAQPQVKKLKVIYESEDFTGKTLNSLSLPHEYNPKNQFLVSANDFTEGLKQPLSLFNAPADRKERMTLLLKNKSGIVLEDIKSIHQDVFSSSAYELKNKLAKHIREQDWIKSGDHYYFDALEAWDGNYDIDSKGAILFEVFVAAWSKNLIDELILKDIKSKASKDKAFDFLTKNFNYRKFLAESLIELSFLDENKFRIYFEKSKFIFDKYKNWGNFHKLDLRHPLGNLKLFKYNYSFYEGPWPGGNETLMKAMHKLSTHNAKVTFGAQARWMTDLSSHNENYLVYLGGQDGFIGSENINDLTPKWVSGSYLKVPFDRDEFKKISASNGQ